jgi:hypothetical protein
LYWPADAGHLAPSSSPSETAAPSAVAIMQVLKKRASRRCSFSSTSAPPYSSLMCDTRRHADAARLAPATCRAATRTGRSSPGRRRRRASVLPPPGARGRPRGDAIVHALHQRAGRRAPAHEDAGAAQAHEAVVDHLAGAVQALDEGRRAAALAHQRASRSAGSSASSMRR